MTAVPVLLYHGVADSGGDDWTVTWARLREHAALVLASGRTPVTVAEISRRLAAGESVEGLVAMSFDDGETSQLPAAEELAASGIPTTVYVTVEFLGTAGYLDDSGMRELAAVPGIEVGSHSVHHVHLDVLRPEQLRTEVRDSRAGLEDRIGREVRGIAYPHGSHDRRVVAAVRDAGYLSGAAVRNALSHDAEDPLSVSRLTVQMDTPLPVVQAFLRGEGRLGETRQRLRTRGFRVYRKARHLTGTAHG